MKCFVSLVVLISANCFCEAQVFGNDFFNSISAAIINPYKYLADLSNFGGYYGSRGPYSEYYQYQPNQHHRHDGFCDHGSGDWDHPPPNHRHPGHDRPQHMPNYPFFPGYGNEEHGRPYPGPHNPMFPGHGHEGHDRPHAGPNYQPFPGQSNEGHDRPHPGTNYPLFPEHGTEGHAKPQPGPNYQPFPGQGSEGHDRPHPGPNYQPFPGQGNKGHDRPHTGSNYPLFPVQGNKGQNRPQPEPTYQPFPGQGNEGQPNFPSFPGQPNEGQDVTQTPLTPVPCYMNPAGCGTFQTVPNNQETTKPEISQPATTQEPPKQTTSIGESTKEPDVFVTPSVPPNPDDEEFKLDIRFGEKGKDNQTDAPKNDISARSFEVNPTAASIGNRNIFDTEGCPSGKILNNAGVCTEVF